MLGQCGGQGIGFWYLKALFSAGPLKSSAAEGPWDRDGLLLGPGGLQGGLLLVLHGRLAASP